MLDVQVLRRLLHLRQAARGVEQRGAATRHDALIDRGLGGVQGVLDPILGLAHLHFRRAADLDHCNARRELRQPLLHLLLLVVRLGRLNRGAQLLAALLDSQHVDVVRRREHGVVLVLLHLLDPAELRHSDILHLQAEVVRDELAARQHGHVLQHRLAVVAEARRLGRGDLEHAAHAVHDQRRQRLRLDVLRNDDQGLGLAVDLSSAAAGVSSRSRGWAQQPRAEPSAGGGG